MTSKQNQATHKVLLVDDDDAVRSMMSEELKRNGFPAVAAASVTAALAHIVTEGFDVFNADPVNA